MPRVNASNGIRPEIRALAVLQLGKTVTPAEVNDYVGTGDYAAKYVSFLNTRYGFTITANKDGRKVVSYTVIAEPDNAADLRSQQPKAPKVKAAKAPKVAKVKAPKVVSIAKAAEIAGKATSITVVDVDAIKAKNLATLRQVGERQAAAAKKVREYDDVTEQFGTNGEIATSYSIDKDWDSVDIASVEDLKALGI